MKKVGKLRQWADEKLGSGVKTQATETFRDMQAEMHLRQAGLEQIHAATQVWIRSLSKKKEGLDKEKSIPVELLGLAAHQHGDDFGQDSAFGALLKRVGTCHQQVARAQEVFTTKTTETVIENMERSLAQMKEYQAANKKLESRRLTYDSSLAKVQKAKREDSKLEEELRAAKVRYEEISDDVEHRMRAIRQGEADLLSDFGELIGLERVYFESCHTAVVQLQTWYNQELGASNHEANLGRGQASTKMVEPQTEHSSLRNHSRQRPARSVSSLLDGPDSVAGDEHDIFSNEYSHVGTTGTHAPGLQMLGARTGSMRPPYRSGSASSDDLSSTRPAPRRFATEPLQQTVSSASATKTVKANFSFDAENENELSLQPGDLICVLQEVSAGWWQGQRLDARSGALLGQAGLFPANYCTVQQTSSRQPAPAPPSTSASIQGSDEDRQHMPARAQTFPRGAPPPVLQSGSKTVGMRESTGNRRPPPPPIPKKKTTAAMPPTPQRQGFPR